MANGINSFRIKLDKLTGNYNPGEKITGEIIIDLNKEKIIKALKLRVKGVCELSWTESTDQDTSFAANEKYIDSVIIVCRPERNDRIEIEAGHNVFRFNFNLPDNIPSTFKHPCAEIKYKLVAIMDRPWKSNHEVEKPFRVERLLPITGTYSLGIDETDVKNFSCWIPCFNGGRMKYRIRLPATGFACGERIPVTINIDNILSSVKITTLTFIFTQKLIFINREPFSNTKTETNIIQRVVDQGPFPKVTASVLEVDVQKLPLSHCQFCNYIDVKYFIHVIINVSGCRRAIQKTYEIVIGTKDPPDSPITTREISNRNRPSVPLESPSTPSVVDLTTVGTVPTPSIGFAYSAETTYSEDPPPSYETVMAIDNLKRASKT